MAASALSPHQIGADAAHGFGKFGVELFAPGEIARRHHADEPPVFRHGQTAQLLARHERGGALHAVARPRRHERGT